MRGKMIIQITSSDFFKIFVGPFFVGLTSYILIAKCDEWKTRKKQSKIGVSIIDSLIEEVNTGISIFHQFNNEKDLPTAYLPNKSWSGISTINDDVLLRIIEVSENINVNHFPPKEIRIHCKNYFEMIAGQWNANVQSINESTPNVIIINTADKLINQSRFLDAAIGVQKMLNQTRELLLKNSKKTFPK